MEYKSDAINTYNCEIKKDIDLSIKRKLDKSGFGSFIINVPVRKKGMTGSGKSNECHKNCDLLVKRYGGSVLRGMVIRQSNSSKDFSLIFHSIWITPENNAVDVTANNFPFNLDFLYFIPLQIQNPKKNIYFYITAPRQIDVHNNSIRFTENYKLSYVHKPISFFKLKNLVILRSINNYFENNDYFNHISKIGGFRNASTASGKRFSLI